MRLPIQIEVIVFRRVDEVEFLLLKRIPAKGGFWQPVTGGLESSDMSYRDACLRELKEEAGITSFLNIIEEFYTFNFTEDIERKEICFGVEVAADTVVDFSGNVYPEHSEYRWVSLAEALKLLKWQNNKDAFKVLSEIISKN